MRKHNYDDIDDKMWNFETMHKTTIKMNNATKIEKNSLLLLITKIDLNVELKIRSFSCFRLSTKSTLLCFR